MTLVASLGWWKFEGGVIILMINRNNRRLAPPEEITP